MLIIHEYVPYCSANFKWKSLLHTDTTYQSDENRKTLEVKIIGL